MTIEIKNSPLLIVNCQLLIVNLFKAISATAETTFDELTMDNEQWKIVNRQSPIVNLIVNCQSSIVN